MPSLQEWLADRKLTHHLRTPQHKTAEMVKDAGDVVHGLSIKASLESHFGKCDKRSVIPKDEGPVIDSRNMPAPILRDTRGIRVRTMAGKLPRHGERPNHDNAIRTQSDGTTQVIVYHPRMDWVDMHGAFVALRDIDVKALPPKLRRAYERAKHRAKSVANNGKPE